MTEQVEKKYIECIEEQPNFPGNYNYNQIKFVRYKDGAIHLSVKGHEEFLYLYPSQVEALKKLL